MSESNLTLRLTADVSGLEKYDPFHAEFERGKTVGLRQARAEYRRGFTDALLVAFIFFAFGAAIVAVLSAVFA